MKIALFLFIPVIILSCNKNTGEAPVPYSEASYKVIISMNWSAPKFGVPGGAHFTRLVGMVHSKDTFLWMPGMPATPGLEDVAEIGNNTKMIAELDAIILKNKALSKFVITPPAVTGTVDTNLIFTTDHPHVSFASMLAPSPDWFMGLNDFTLFRDKAWINDIVINLMVYDAGTEDGDVFDYNNPGTVPQQNIALLSPSTAGVLANGNLSITSIGSVHFIKN